MNITMLLGRLVREVEVKHTNGAEPMAFCRFTVAVNRMKKDEADFIQCVAFGKTAEYVGKYGQKGSQIAVSGHIQTGSFQKQDGTKVNTFEVMVDRAELIRTETATTLSAPTPATNEATNDGFVQAELLDDGNLPFK